MFVKVNEAYKGIYGHFDRGLNTVTAKRAGDPPFEVPDDVAKRQILNGVLVYIETGAAHGMDAALGAPSGEVKKTADPTDDTPPADAPAAAGDAERDVDSMSYKELQAAAKARGIAVFGKNTADLRELIRSHDAAESEEAPDLAAADPV